MSHHTKSARAGINKLLTKGGYKPAVSKDPKKTAAPSKKSGKKC